MARIRSVAVLALLLILLAYSLAIGLKNILRYNAFVQEYDSLSTVYLEEKRMNADYRWILSKLENPDYWEYLAKKRLGYVRKTEIVYKVI